MKANVLRAMRLSRAKKKRAANRKKTTEKRSFVRRALRWAIAAVFLICLIPAVLTIIYRFEFTKPASTLMMSRIATGQPMSRQWIDIDDMSDNLQHSVLMSEDGQFCRHHGVDLGELKGVVDAALAGEETRGASTITMQVARNLFLWNSRSFIRKGLEIPLAIWIDFVMPKKRIMEIYLNIAEWGPGGIFGIDQAAGFHFGAEATALSRRRAALLAVTLPNPILRDPAKPNNGLNRLARIIERRARGAGAYVECLD